MQYGTFDTSRHPEEFGADIYEETSLILAAERAAAESEVRRPVADDLDVLEDEFDRVLDREIIARLADRW